MCFLPYLGLMCCAPHALVPFARFLHQQSTKGRGRGGLLEPLSLCLGFIFTWMNCTMKVERCDSSKSLSSGTCPFVVNELLTSIFCLAAGAMYRFCIMFWWQKVNDEPVASEGTQQEAIWNVRIIFRYDIVKLFAFVPLISGLFVFSSAIWWMDLLLHVITKHTVKSKKNANVQSQGHYIFVEFMLYSIEPSTHYTLCTLE